MQWFILVSFIPINKWIQRKIKVQSYYLRFTMYIESVIFVVCMLACLLPAHLLNLLNYFPGMKYSKTGFKYTINMNILVAHLVLVL